MSVTTALPRGSDQARPGRLVRLFDYKPFLIVVCLTPAIGLLAVFLTYPLGLGIWLAFTDTTIGRRGVFVGLENFQYLLTDPLWCWRLRRSAQEWRNAWGRQKGPVGGAPVFLWKVV